MFTNVHSFVDGSHPASSPSCRRYVPNAQGHSIDVRHVTLDHIRLYKQFGSNLQMKKTCDALALEVESNMCVLLPLNLRM